MTRVTFGLSSNSKDIVDGDGAISGDPLIFNVTTGQFEPYSQADAASQAAYDASNGGGGTVDFSALAQTDYDSIAAGFAAGTIDATTLDASTFAPTQVDSILGIAPNDALAPAAIDWTNAAADTDFAAAVTGLAGADIYLTGGTFAGTTLTLTDNDAGTSDLVVDFAAFASVYTDNNDGTYSLTAGGSVTPTIVDTRAVSNPITDAGDYFTGTNVEAALQEAGEWEVGDFDPITRFHKAIGVPRGEDIVIGFWGQSNMSGSDVGGSLTVEADIFITDNVENPTAIVPAAFGSGALPGTNNNISVHFMNELRRSGLVDPTSRLVILPFWEAGESLSRWILGDANEARFTSFTTSLATLGITKIAGFAGAQGESDSSTAITGFETDALWAAGFETFKTQCRALPQVGRETPFIQYTLGQWYGQNSNERNTAIMQLDQLDPFVAVVNSTDLLTMGSGTNDENHYAGASLEAMGIRGGRSFMAMALGERADGDLVNGDGRPRGGRGFAVGILQNGATDLTQDVLKGPHTYHVRGPHTFQVHQTVPQGAAGPIVMHVDVATPANPVTITSVNNKLYNLVGSGLGTYTIEQPGVYMFWAANRRLQILPNVQDFVRPEQAVGSGTLATQVITIDTATPSVTLPAAVTITNPDTNYNRVVLIKGALRTNVLLTTPLSGEFDVVGVNALVNSELIMNLDEARVYPTSTSTRMEWGHSFTIMKAIPAGGTLDVDFEANLTSISGVDNIRLTFTSLEWRLA